MSGNRIGGLKAAAKNKAKDPDFYKRIGAKGGAEGRTGGFASLEVGDDGLTGIERARVAGKKGGIKSKRHPVKRADVEVEVPVVHRGLLQRLLRIGQRG